MATGNPSIGLAIILVFVGSPTLTSAGGAAAQDARPDVASLAARLHVEAALTVDETHAMSIALGTYVHLAGDPVELIEASTLAADLGCRGACLVFLAEAQNMTLRAEMPPVRAGSILDEALETMALERDASPECWTNIEQGARLWAEVDADVQRWLADRTAHGAERAF